MNSEESYKRKHCCICGEFYATPPTQTCSECYTGVPSLQDAIESNKHVLNLYKLTKRSYTRKQLVDEKAARSAQMCRDHEERLKTYNYFKIISLLNDRQPWSLTYLRVLFDYSTRVSIAEALPIFEYFQQNFKDDWAVLSFQILVVQHVIDLYNLNICGTSVHGVVHCYYTRKALQCVTQFPNCIFDRYHADQIWNAYISNDSSQLVYTNTTTRYYQYAVSALWIMWNYRKVNLGNYAIVPTDIIRRISSMISIGDWAIDDFDVIHSFNY